MGPDRFSYPPIPTDLPKPKPEVGSTNESIQNIPVVEAEDVSNVSESKDTESLPDLKTPESSSVSRAEILLEGDKTSDELVTEARSEYINNLSTWQAFKKEKSLSEFSPMEKVNRDIEEETLSKLSADSYKKYQETIREIVKLELDKEREKTMKAWTVGEVTELLALKQAELVEKYVIKEAAYLEDQKIESWPPKERGWWSTTLESYSKLPKSLKFAASAAVGTAVAVSMPGIAVGGMVGLGGIAGLRLARGIGGSFVGAGINKLVGSILGESLEKKTKQHEEKLVSSDTFSKVSFENIQKQHEEFLLKKNKLKTRNKILSITAGIVSGVGLSAASGILENPAATSLGFKASTIGESHESSTVHVEKTPEVEIETPQPEIGPKSQFPADATRVKMGSSVSNYDFLRSKGPATLPEVEIAADPLPVEVPKNINLDLGQSYPIPDAELNYEPVSIPKTTINPEGIGATPSSEEVSSGPANVDVPVELEKEGLAAQIERLTVRPKEGFWQPVSREVEFRIKTDPEKYGLVPEDVIDEDSPELAKAVAKETNRILRENEVIDSNGLEKKISNSGEILELTKEGEIKVNPKAVYVENPIEIKAPKQITQVVAEPSNESLVVEPRKNLINSVNDTILNRPAVRVSSLVENESIIDAGSSKDWLTPDLQAHSELVQTEEALNSFNNNLDFEFYKGLPLSGQQEFSNILKDDSVINYQLENYENYRQAVEQGGLDLPENNLAEDLREKIEEMREVYKETLNAKQAIVSELPNYDSKIKIQDMLKLWKSGESANWEGGYGNLAEKISTMDITDHDLEKSLEEFLNDHVTQNGLETPVATKAIEIPSYSVSKVSEAAQKLITSHAQINVTRAEMPEYMENLDLSLEASKKMSLEDFNKNFVNNSEFNSTKAELTEICRKTAESIKSLEDAGWKVNSEVKDSIHDAIEKMQELDGLSDEYRGAWKEFLSSVGLDEQSYTNTILNVKDNTGHSLVIDTGTVLDMPKNYTPSQIGKFVGLVDRVKELTENLTPEELVEIRKLPVDQLIKQNIKL